MPRAPRLHVPGGCYHVILRGNHREALFGSTADRDVLNEIVGDAVAKTGARFHAFCWMTNHLHALVQVADRPLGKTMHRIAVRYSRHRHRQLRTRGHLFERRYKAKLVDVDAYFLTLVRYIHDNPVKAHIVSDPADYPWSSHRAYLGREQVPWLTTDFELSLFGTEIDAARTAYARFMSVPTTDDDDPDTATHPEDPRILGTDAFIAKIPYTPLRPRGYQSLEELATTMAERLGLTVDHLRSPSRARSLTPARVDLFRSAIDMRIAPLSEVARFLNRNAASLARLLARHPHQKDE